MTAPDPSPEKDPAKATFRRMRNALSGPAVEWVRTFDQKTKRRQIGVRDVGATLVQPIATIERKCSFDDEELLFNARAFAEASVIMVERAAARIRAQDEQIAALNAEIARLKKPKGPAADAGRLCNDPAFIRFLEEAHDLPAMATKDQVAIRLRSLLSIASRAELDTDDAAAARWSNLKTRFDNWRKGR